LDAGYHHLTSAVIHAFNVLLLFLILWQATAALGRSFLVAALFACYPLNVESVAWASERKSLLSMLFFLLALGAYLWHSRQPRFSRLSLVAIFFAFALASKPMAVTLPFVLLLLDYWPLQRLSAGQDSDTGVPGQPVGRLLLEKVPLFALSAASCMVTIWVQSSGGAVRSLQLFPLGARIGNALWAYLLYIWKMFLPFGLAVLYPHPGISLPVWKPAVAVAFLCATSIAVWRKRRTRPYLLVGWCWFLGTLVPVIGIIQVGDQAMADRYAYLPLIGLFVAMVWGTAELLDFRRVNTARRWVFAVVVLGVVCLITAQQLTYWQDGVTIWSHTLQVTGGNLDAEKQLANAMIRQRDTAAAMPHLIHISRLDPRDVSAHVNMGTYYASTSRVPEAVEEFKKAVSLTEQGQLKPEDQKYQSSALLNLGLAYTLAKNYPEALISFERANQLDATMVNQVIDAYDNSLVAAPSEASYLKLSLLLRAKRQDRQATSMLEDAANANPDYSDIRQLLKYLNQGQR
jgi:Tfp pilus assembly protein PilF